jgi:F-type H+-transporting ATPase subunit epsilon
MHLKVITPNKTIFSEEIEELIVNTPSGQIGILPHHMPLVTSVQPGEMILKIKGKEQHYAVTGGFLEVGKEGITLLADYAIQSEDINVEKAMAAKKRAEEVLKRTKEGVSERDFAVAQSDLRRAISELHVANRRRRERAAVPQR